MSIFDLARSEWEHALVVGGVRSLLRSVFLKDKLEGLLSKEVFLDSDDLRGECNHSNSCDAEDTTH